MITVTAVECDPDLRHATVFLSSTTPRELEALSDLRVRLQAAISKEVRLKRTPQLTFVPDPAVAAIVMGWPARFRGERAARLGLVPDPDFASVIDLHLAETAQ